MSAPGAGPLARPRQQPHRSGPPYSPRTSVAEGLRDVERHHGR